MMFSFKTFKHTAENDCLVGMNNGLHISGLCVWPYSRSHIFCSYLVMRHEKLLLLYAPIL